MDNYVALFCGGTRINEKRKPEGLRFLRVGHPANNRYRCFLSNLAGLAAPPPPDSLEFFVYRKKCSLSNGNHPCIRINQTIILFRARRQT